MLFLLCFLPIESDCKDTHFLSFVKNYFWGMRYFGEEGVKQKCGAAADFVGWEEVCF